ncbi:MAG: hypothetical protein ACRDQ5_16180 [Sciscionella sp.]
MSQALNTTVIGSSGTCVAAADRLSRVYAGAHGADGASRDARTAAEGGWDGPAAEAFADDLRGMPGDFAHLADRAYQCEWALRGFAESLDKVVDTMRQVLDTARAGELRVDGPFVIAPEPPAGVAGLPAGKCTPRDAQVAVHNFNNDIAALREAQAEYNAKAAVYNECKALVEDARRIEKRAHEQLRASMTSVSEAAADWVSIGSAVASRVLGSIGAMENPRRDAANKAERLKTQAQFLEDFANGTVASASPLQKRLLEMSAEKAKDAKAAQARVEQFERFINKVPQEMRAGIIAYPGRRAIDDPGEHAKTPLPKGAKEIARGMPYLGGAVTALSESIGAATGEQSWEKAGADTAGVLAGGALGGAEAGFLYGAVVGAPAGPIGSVVVGGIGTVTGAIAGQQLVDHFVPK